MSDHAAKPRNILLRGLAAGARGFNAGFDRLSLGYGGLTRRLLRVGAAGAGRLCRAAGV